jgi:hypothetical protein
MAALRNLVLISPMTMTMSSEDAHWFFRHQRVEPYVLGLVAAVAFVAAGGSLYVAPLVAAVIGLVTVISNRFVARIRARRRRT